MSERDQLREALGETALRVLLERGGFDSWWDEIDQGTREDIAREIGSSAVAVLDQQGWPQDRADDLDRRWAIAAAIEEHVHYTVNDDGLHGIEAAVDAIVALPDTPVTDSDAPASPLGTPQVRWDEPGAGIITVDGEHVASFNVATAWDDPWEPKVNAAGVALMDRLPRLVQEAEMAYDCAQRYESERDAARAELDDAQAFVVDHPILVQDIATLRSQRDEAEAELRLAMSSRDAALREAARYEPIEGWMVGPALDDPHRWADGEHQCDEFPPCQPVYCYRRVTEGEEG